MSVKLNTSLYILDRLHPDLNEINEFILKFNNLLSLKGSREIYPFFVLDSMTQSQTPEQ